MQGKAAVIALSVTALSGCYHYVPVASNAPPAGSHVAVEISTRGAVNLIPRLGDNVVSLEGELTSADENGITVSVLSVKRRGDLQASNWTGASVTLAGADVIEVKKRQLSKGRTIIASSALGAAMVGLVVAIAKATGLASGGTGERPIPTP